MEDYSSSVPRTHETDLPEVPLMTMDEFMALRIPRDLDRIMMENGIQHDMDGEIFASDRNILNFLGRAGISVSDWWEKDQITGGIQPKEDSHRLIRSTSNLLNRLYWMSVMRDMELFRDCDSFFGHICWMLSVHGLGKDIYFSFI